MSQAVQFQHEPTSAHSIHHLIHLKAVEVSIRYKKSEAELLNVLEQVENHQVYLHLGRSSLFQYGIQDLKLSESVVYNLITVMRKSKTVPELKTKIQQGHITLSNARKIAPILTLENQSEWLEKASELSQRQLEKEIVKIYPLATTPERTSYVTPERVKVELGLSEKVMMKLRKAQDIVSQSLQKSASLEDTLLAVTEFYLKHKDPVTKAKRIYIKKGLSAPTSEPVSLQVNPSSKSNERKSIPANILHHVNLRDQRKCSYINIEGKPCNQSRWTEIHHIVPVVQGGENSLDNLTTLCSVHHKWVHSKK